jgi:hypothetical protein
MSGFMSATNADSAGLPPAPRLGRCPTECPARPGAFGLGAELPRSVARDQLRPVHCASACWPSPAGTLAAAKAQVNRFGVSTATELQSSNDMFFSTLALPSAQPRRAKVRSIGYGTLGRADDDDTDKQRD